jgi:hypothetical protein
VEIFDFHMPCHSTFVWRKLQHNNRNYMTAVEYQVIGFMCYFDYGMGLQPHINQCHTNTLQRL